MTRPIVEFQNVSKTYHVGAAAAPRDPRPPRRELQGPRRLRLRPAGPQPRRQDHARQGAAVDLPSDLGNDPAAGPRRGRMRSTLARVGYLHESPAFPRYLTARGFPRLLRRPVPA